MTTDAFGIPAEIVKMKKINKLPPIERTSGTINVEVVQL